MPNRDYTAFHARQRARLIFSAAFVFNGFMKADFRISVKDNSRGKNLKVELIRVPFARQFWVRMKWPKDAGAARQGAGGGVGKGWRTATCAWAG
jgi:hypothetical protein